MNLAHSCAALAEIVERQREVVTRGEKLAQELGESWGVGLVAMNDLLRANGSRLAGAAGCIRDLSLTIRVDRRHPVVIA